MQRTLLSTLAAAALPALATAQTAGFTFQKLAPHAYQFTDTSSAGATQWAWDFDGDGAVDSTGQNPTWTFPGAGVYPVTLTTTFAAGSASSTETVFDEHIEMPSFTNTFTSASSTRDALRPFVEDIDFVSDDPDVEDGVERVLIALMTVVSTPDYLVQK